MEICTIKQESTNYRSSTIQHNKDIISFFEQARYGNLKPNADYSDEKAFDLHLLELLRKLRDPTHLAIFFYNFSKLQEQRNIYWLESLYLQIFSILLSEKEELFLMQWNVHTVSSVFYWLRNCLLIPEVFLAKFNNIIPTVKWDIQWMGKALYGLQNCTRVPTGLLWNFAFMALSIKKWDAQWIGNALVGIAHIEWEEANMLVNFLFQKIEILQLEMEDFIGIQSLVIWLNYVWLNVPDSILEKWDSFVNSEGRMQSTATNAEKMLFEYLSDYWDLDDMEILHWAYLNGHEVDILILTTEGKVFAIIESDGSVHAIISKRNRIQKRDQFFLNAWITDLIIRKTKDWCRIVERL